MKSMLQSKRYTVRAIMANMEDNLAIRNVMIYHDKQNKQ